MKAKSTIFILFGVMTSYVFAQDQPAPANCQFAQVVVADGIADEWPLKWLEEDDKKISYNVCSDENNLYIRMKTNDDMWKRKMAFFGFTVWMDANGKKKKKLGLKFPTGVEGKERVEAQQSQHESGEAQKLTAPERAERQRKMNKAWIADLELIELIGLADEPLTSTRSGITNGIKVAIDTSEHGTYVYEAIIPFKSFRLSKASIEELGIGFETGKYVPPPNKNQAGGANSGASTGFGSAARGGYGGYGQGYGSGMRRGGGQTQRTPEISYSSSAWVTVPLK